MSEYNAATGAAINASFITDLTNEMDFGLAVSGNTLFVTNSGDGTVGRYDAKMESRSTLASSRG